MTDFNTQTCQPCKFTNVENLAKKILKKPGESVKNLETLTGRLFRSLSVVKDRRIYSWSDLKLDSYCYIYETV